MTVSRWTGEPGLDTLLAGYHLATEAEKGAAVTGVADLPARYRAEALTPATAFASDAVFVARLDRDAPLAGCVVVTAPSAGSDGDVEVKRLWVAESARGRGVAKALLLAALTHADVAGAGVRLSVWRWRAAAVALYASHGFTEVPSWDDRRDLLCLRRGA
jgi:putative acetyltransferase